MVIESTTFITDARGRRTAVIVPLAEYERMLAALHTPSPEGLVPSTEPVPLASLFGAGKGAFASLAEADAFIRGERDAWGS